MGFSATSPVESTGKRTKDPNERPLFIGRLKPNAPAADEDPDDSVSPRSPPLVSLVGAYTLNFQPKQNYYPGDPPVPGTMGTFFHNGYGHGFVSIQPTSFPRESIRSPPRVVVPPLQTSSPRQSEKHTPPMTSTTGLSIAQSAVIDDPRDHSVLESIYISLHESRFINLRPLLIIPTYLNSFFGQVKSHPTMLYLAPDRKLDGPGLAGGRLDAGEGTPLVHGILDNLAARAFGARAVGEHAPPVVVIGNEAAMPDSAEILTTSVQQHAAGIRADDPDNEKTLSPRFSARQRGNSIPASSRPRSSTGAVPSVTSPGTTAGWPPQTFVEDYLAIDISRPMRRKKVTVEGSVTIGTFNFLSHRYYQYDVGHAGLLMSIESTLR